MWVGVEGSDGQEVAGEWWRRWRRRRRWDGEDGRGKREGQREREESHEAAPLQYFICSQLSLLLHLPLPQHPQDC